ncbi:hypothetical protein Poly24_37320 [Rosistilla carotiformis]|uniref:DUF2271 domain-containing protein n=1 Tax=Rosistilla carotiformis TaxID=2528017 RepID=A0A518JWU6_9BACT|nr:hypothetical protein Poly24_37320 [Rosistilla carotiformis]
MLKRFPLLAASFALAFAMPAAPATAAEIELSIEIPRLNVSEYHRPYVAAWIQTADRKQIRNLTVWYQMRDTNEGHGTKWLPDLRQWWRISGRSLDVPVDGVTGATRPVGKHSLTFTDKQPQLADLPAGEYTLIVEASREVGGRELVKIPFKWPATSSQTLDAQGEKELGEVTLSVKP